MKLLLFNDLLNFGRTFMYGQVLTISCVLVVVENKLRYYGKFQNFLKYNFIAWTLCNCLDISLHSLTIYPLFPPVTLLLNTINL